MFRLNGLARLLSQKSKHSISAMERWWKAMGAGYSGLGLYNTSTDLEADAVEIPRVRIVRPQCTFL